MKGDSRVDRNLGLIRDLMHSCEGNVSIKLLVKIRVKTNGFLVKVVDVQRLKDNRIVETVGKIIRDRNEIYRKYGLMLMQCCVAFVRTFCVRFWD